MTTPHDRAIEHYGRALQHRERALHAADQRDYELERVNRAWAQLEISFAISNQLATLTGPQPVKVTR